jgi:hypothetical protein
LHYRSTMFKGAGYFFSSSFQGAIKTERLGQRQPLLQALTRQTLVSARSHFSGRLRICLARCAIRRSAGVTGSLTLYSSSSEMILPWGVCSLAARNGIKRAKTKANVRDPKNNSFTPRSFPVVALDVAKITWKRKAAIYQFIPA